MKSETLAIGGATITARTDDTTTAAVTEEETTAVADLNATTEVAGLIETIGQTMVAIGIVQNATTTISLSVMNATDAVNQEETAEADRTTEGSKAVNNEVVALRETTTQAIEKTATGIALSATMTTLLGERNATSAVRQKPAAVGDDLHAVTTDVHSKTAINAVVTEEVATGLVETTDVAVTEEVATGLVAATETHMTEPKDDLLDVNHAVKIHVPPGGNLENSVNHAVKALDTLTTDPLVI